MVEIVVDAEALRSDLCGQTGLLEDVVVGAGVDLEDAVALGRGAFDLVAEDFWGGGSGPGGHGDGVALFLAEEFVNGQVEMFAHCVVQGAEQARGDGGAMVVDEVEGAEADKLRDGIAGRFGVGPHSHVAITGDAGVGVDFVHDAAVDAVEIDAALGVAAG